MCRRIVFLVASAFLQLVLSQDYCNNLSEIPYIDTRDTQYRVENGEKKLNDRFFRKGWYDIPGTRTLARSAPGLNFCGSLYPIWRKVKQGEVSTMCIQSSASETCFREFNITTGMCDGGEVFELTPSPVYNSVYCLEYPSGTEPPAQVASPTVTVDLRHAETESELVFYGNFKKHDDDDVWYRTYWFVDGKQIEVAGPSLWGVGLSENHALTESTLRKAGTEKVGFQVRCSVRASFGEDSVQSRPSSSSSRFIGIEVSRRSLVVDEGHTAQFELQLTAPFGCGNHIDPSSCVLSISSHTLGNPGQDVCKSSLITTIYCGVAVTASKWDQRALFKVTGQSVQVHSNDRRTIQLKLKTDDDPIHTIWRDYDLGIIAVQVVRNSSRLKSKVCYAVNDPHMKTFDGRNYELHVEGHFTLYRHAVLPIEVQLKTTLCSPRRDNIMCNCGVAIRAGRTVFEINKCGGRPHWDIDYSSCGDNGQALHVTTSGWLHEIYLPTGGKIEVWTWTRFLNVYLYPSVEDYEKSNGLCGYMSNGCTDDFTMRDKSYSLDDTSRSRCHENSRSSLPMFTESWKVPDDENLFNHNNFNDSFPSAWFHALTFCTCPDENNEDFVNQAKCKPTLSYKLCNSIPRHLAEPSTCTKSKRRKRYIESFTPENGRFKRSEQSWTEETARAYCENAFENSTTVRVCRNVTEQAAIDSLNNCVLDIMLTGTTDFTIFAIDTLRTQCQEEVLVNPDFHKKEPSLNHKSVMDVVIAETCPNDCSHLGVCVQGICKCNDPYGGVDCSVDLGSPPRLDWAGDQGHCDTSEENCDVLSVYGETFVDEAICHVEQIKVKESGFEVFGRRTVETVVASISEVQCRVGSVESVTGSDGDFIMAYRLSVSNRGDGFPPGVPLMVYDGRCIEVNVTATEFTWGIKGSYCNYKGRCIPDQTSHPQDDCLICEVSEDGGRWKMKNDTSCEVSPRPGNDFPIAPVIGGAVAAVVIAVVIIVALVICIPKRNANNLSKK